MGDKILILERREGEEIVIDDEIELVVMGFGRECGKPYVRLGFKADKRIPIYRKEIWLQIKEQEDKEADERPTDQPKVSSASPKPVYRSRREDDRLAE